MTEAVVFVMFVILGIGVFFGYRLRRNRIRQSLLRYDETRQEWSWTRHDGTRCRSRTRPDDVSGAWRKEGFAEECGDSDFAPKAPPETHTLKE